jgi:hypothetical protein
MQWKIDIQCSDDIKLEQRFELEIRSSFHDLPDGKVGLSIADGNETDVVPLI